MNNAMNRLSAPISVTSLKEGLRHFLSTDGDKMIVGKKVKKKEAGSCHVTATVLSHVTD